MLRMVKEATVGFQRVLSVQDTYIVIRFSLDLTASCLFLLPFYGPKHRLGFV